MSFSGDINPNNYNGSKDMTGMPGMSARNADAEYRRHMDMGNIRQTCPVRRRRDPECSVEEGTVCVESSRQSLHALCNTFLMWKEGPLIWMSDILIRFDIDRNHWDIVPTIKKFRWLWTEWITTVDHKKIGIMYILCRAS